MGRARHLGEQQRRIVREQLPGFQVDDAVAAVQQVRVRVELVGNDGDLRFRRGEGKRTLDARTGLGTLRSPENVFLLDASFDHRSMDLPRYDLHAALNVAINIRCPVLAIPDEPPLPRDHVPERRPVLLNKSPRVSEFC